MERSAESNPLVSAEPEQKLEMQSGPGLYWAAWRRAAGRPGLWLGLWLLYQGLGLLVMLPLLWGLHHHLGRRPIAAALARGQADVLWAELLGTDGGLAPLGLGALLVGLCLRWSLRVSLSGGLLCTLLRPGTPARVASDGLLGRAARSLGAAWKLHGLSLLVLRLPLLLLLAGSMALVGRGHRPLLGTATVGLLHYAPILLLGVLAWSALGSVVHITQLQLLSRPGPAGSAFRALKAGLRQISQTKQVLQPLAVTALLSVGLYAGWIVAARVLASALDVRLFVVLALVVRQLAALGRSLLSLWQLALSAELFHRLPPTTTQSRI